MKAPLEIDRIESSRVNGDHVRLRLTGRWLDPAGADEEELLVVEVEGRRHRFPAVRRSEDMSSRLWSATFALPVWAEPSHEGQAALWVGDWVVPVAPPRGGTRPVAPEPSVAPPATVTPEPAVVSGAAGRSESPGEFEPPAEAGPAAPVESEAPRAGPLADLLLKETVAALHAELDQRTADAARMRGALADARSELEARDAMQAALEVTHAELRVELERLTEAVERRRAEFDVRIAEGERDQAEAGRQLVELRAALDERAGQVAQAHEQLAERQWAADLKAVEARRLREELAVASVARSAAESEVVGLRSELERLGTEVAATRERVGAEGGDLGSAHRLLADARALAEQLRGREGAD